MLLATLPSLGLPLAVPRGPPLAAMLPVMAVLGLEALLNAAGRPLTQSAGPHTGAARAAVPVAVLVATRQAGHKLPARQRRRPRQLGVVAPYGLKVKGRNPLAHTALLETATSDRPKMWPRRVRYRPSQIRRTGRQTSAVHFVA